MTAIPAPRTEQRNAAAEGLLTHAGALRDHAERLRASAAALAWQGPEADAFRQRIEALAARCATASDGLTASAAPLDRS